GATDRLLGQAARARPDLGEDPHEPALEPVRREPLTPPGPRWHAWRARCLPAGFAAGGRPARRDRCAEFPSARPRHTYRARRAPQYGNRAHRPRTASPNPRASTRRPTAAAR